MGLYYRGAVIELTFWGLFLLLLFWAGGGGSNFRRALYSEKILILWYSISMDV